MPTYSQDGRLMRITTPLGKDALLLVGIYGAEEVSRLFHITLDVLADNRTEVPFDKLLGATVSAALTLPDGKTSRYFTGLCRRVVQGEQDKNFTAYQLEIVPPLWVLTRRTQSRIIQQVSVPKVLQDLVAGEGRFELQGTFEPRDFLVQYRESDFDFFSRLCEEEGFYYFFKHTADDCQLVVANTPHSHPDLPGQSTLEFRPELGGRRSEDRVFAWRKTQELRSGKVTLWDHCFELPHKHLEAEKTVQDSAKVGTASHKLAVGGNSKMELYDWPAGHAERFDGVDKGGADNAAGLAGIPAAGVRLATVLMQEETAAAVAVEGESNCRNVASGCKFTFKDHVQRQGAVCRPLGGARGEDAGRLPLQRRRSIPL